MRYFAQGIDALWLSKNLDAWIDFTMQQRAIHAYPFHNARRVYNVRSAMRPYTFEPILHTAPYVDLLTQFLVLASFIVCRSLCFRAFHVSKVFRNW